MIYFILLLCLLFLCLNRNDAFVGTQTISIKKIFRTRSEQQKGLMFKKNIEPDIGYMFYYNPPAATSFWMKNTYIPLDIIFIDEHKRIVHMLENMVPHDLTSKGYNKKVKYVIEIKSGFVKKNNLRNGQKIAFNYI